MICCRGQFFSLASTEEAQNLLKLDILLNLPRPKRERTRRKSGLPFWRHYALPPLPPPPPSCCLGIKKKKLGFSWQVKLYKVGISFFFGGGGGQDHHVWAGLPGGTAVLLSQQHLVATCSSLPPSLHIQRRQVFPVTKMPNPLPKNAKFEVLFTVSRKIQTASYSR